VTEPELFWMRDVMMLKVVDLPAPFGPSRPMTSPLFTPKLLFWIAVNGLPEG